MEELRTIFSVIALLISFWSAYTVRRLWYQTHRPIVSAVVRENSSGVGTCLFDLVLINSGNRPATDISFEVKEKDIEKIIIKNTPEEKKQELINIFNCAKIQQLLAGEEAKTFFFAFSTKPNNSVDILEYESQMPVVIHYSDLEKRKYTSKQNLYIRDNKGFGGHNWRDEK